MTQHSMNKPASPSMNPVESFVVANGLRHHVLTWNDAAEETVLLAHGFLDLAWSFRAFAEDLAGRGYRVVAWDWRGHGESEWVGKGGYYHFPDYVLDLERLFPQLVAGPEGTKAHLIAHSMGGTVSTMFAGVRGEKLKTLTLIEGLGPPPYKFERSPGKMRAWFDSVAKSAGRDPRPLSIEDALKRMRIQNPTLDDELGLFLAEKSTRPTDVDGERLWRFDPLHRSTSPMPFRTEVFGAFLKRIPCPTLVVAGEKGYRLPDEEARYGQIPTHEFVEIPGVGHMVHWFEAPALAEAWLSFITPVS